MERMVRAVKGHMRSVLGKFGHITRSRKAWLFAGLSAAAALAAMLLYYVHWLPTSDVAMRFELWGTAAPDSQGGQYTINYIMADDKYVPLKGFATSDDPHSGWAYNGTLYTYSAEPLDISLRANRAIEASLRSGPWVARGSATIGSAYEQYDFYDESGKSQKVMRVPLHSFLNRQTLAIGFSVYVACFLMLHLLIGKRFYGYWRENVGFADIIVVAAILLANILFNYDWMLLPGAKGGIMFPDVGMYIADGKQILSGMVPYSQFYEEKGPILLLLFALADAIWFPYGIWVLGTLLCFIGFIFLYKALRVLFSKSASLFSVLMAIAACQAFRNGINTEYLSVPFINAALYLFLKGFAGNGEVEKRQAVLIGMLFAFVALMRVNNAYLWVAAVPLLSLLLFKDRGIVAAIRQLLLMLLGIGMVAGPVLAWLIANGAAKDWYLDTIGYASNYVSEITLLEKFRNGIDLLNGSGVRYMWVVLSLAALFHASVKCMPASPASPASPSSKERRLAKNSGVFTRLLYCASALGFFCATMSGYAYPYYMLILLPMAALFCACFFELLYDFLLLAIGSNGKAYARIAAALVLACFAGTSYISMANAYGDYGSREKDIPNEQLAYTQIANYIECNSGENDKFSVFDGYSNGAFIQNLLGGKRIADTYFFINWRFWENNREKYMSALSRNNKFFINTNSASRMPDGVQPYIDGNYALIMDVDNIALYEYTGGGGK
jgi:hypothetical protein